jgi:hypothetical protein
MFKLCVTLIVMIPDTYPLEEVDTKLQFSFVSADTEGENRIIKIIAYDVIKKHKVIYYNLGFGDLDAKTGEVDDEVESNNGDMRKILSTVVSTLPRFFQVHPTKKIHMDGSTLLRKQYYHKLVRDYHQRIAEHYLVEGCLNGTVERFDEKKEYDFLLISLK